MYKQQYSRQQSNKQGTYIMQGHFRCHPGHRFSGLAIPIPSSTKIDSELWQDTYMVSNRVFMLHFAGDHYAARLKATMRVVWEACSCLMRGHTQLVQHQKGIQILERRGAQRPAYLDASAFHNLLTLHHLQIGGQLILVRGEQKCTAPAGD